MSEAEKAKSDAEETPAPADTRTQTGTDTAIGTETTRPREHGGPKGPEPTRYGDWEKNGRCSDF
jgi:hypothetical protein